MDAQTQDQDRWPRLTPIEARVLGCLVEKQATTPDVYPLTVNAAQSAANQKTAREPVMSASFGDVQHALRQLEGHRFARQSFSSRAERHEHVLGTALDVPQPQVVLLALLMLRGAQTLAELVTRSERMHPFADADDARHHLERLAGKGLAVRIPPLAGRREDRYAHLLCGPVDVAAIAAAGPARESAGDAGLAARVEALEAEVLALREALDALTARVPV
ncbi:conserved hypothetical protein [Luteimonas sp. 9C]|uniref:YceH family protein n=1 Tax=Luteimonas sp. 9C TaxID=2653148 RepID=UPI0012F400AE|nr:DUF480 domain-containing protein [Luteimonas sp. 9C]VXB18020.1 conserved hypothetical protein [Luteimonas sp. 9C]